MKVLPPMPRAGSPGIRWLAVAWLLLGSMLTACGGSGAGAADSTPSRSAAAEGWSFTDDRGVTVTLDSTPERIVTYTEEGIAPLMHLGITPIGAFGDAPIKGHPALEGLDTSGIESLGEIAGEVNLEKMAAMDVDLIVTTWLDGFAPTGFADENQAGQAEQIAPIVALTPAVPARQSLERWVELGEALGADLASPELVEARERYEAAWQGLEEAAAANPDLTVMMVSPDPSSGMYVGNPPFWGELQDMQAAGLNLVTPTETEEFDGYWELLSWEQADKYAADVILWDARPYAHLLPPDELDLPPTWDRLPAVAADQLGPYRGLVNTSYQAYADTLEELTRLIERAEDVV